MCSFESHGKRLMHQFQCGFGARRGACLILINMYMFSSKFGAEQRAIRRLCSVPVLVVVRASLPITGKATPCRSRWPSGLRRYVKAVFRKGVGSNPTLDIHFAK